MAFRAARSAARFGDMNSFDSEIVSG